MGKALVIKNVDFNTNKIETVEFSDKECTSVSVSPSTIVFTQLGETQELTVSKTPSDTTDAVWYESSNSDVCTVSNGIVTCIGIGTATVTVHCGSASATCSVSVNSVVYNAVWTTGQPGNITTSGKTMRFIGNEVTSKMAAVKDVSSGGNADVYYQGKTVHILTVPTLCDTIRVTMDDFIGNSIQIIWYDSTSKPYESYPTCFESLNIESQTILQNGNEFTVPEGADSFVVFVDT